jgi:hypothetical protein
MVFMRRQCTRQTDHVTLAKLLQRGSANMDKQETERDWAWLGFALQEGFKHGLTDAREMLAHATPEILVAQLPRDLTTLLIAGALKTGKLTPESVLEIAPPPVLAEHLEPNVLWGCLSDAAEAANLTVKGGSASASGKRWMGAILARAISDGLTSADDVVKHVPPAEWVRDAPPDVVSAMIAAGLARGSFDAKLALEHLTPELMAEHLSPPLVWACIADAAAKTFNLTPQAHGSDKPASDAKANKSLEQAAATMSASRLDAMVVRKSPLAVRKEAEANKYGIPAPAPTPPAPVITSAPPLTPLATTDAESWEAVAVPIGEDEVVEETTSSDPPEPPRAFLRR